MPTEQGKKRTPNEINKLPIAFLNDLYYSKEGKKSPLTPQKAFNTNLLRARATGDSETKWEDKGVHFCAFEDNSKHGNCLSKLVDGPKWSQTALCYTRWENGEFVYYLNYDEKKDGDFTIELQDVQKMKDVGCKVVVVMQPNRTRLGTEKEFLRLADVVVATENDHSVLDLQNEIAEKLVFFPSTKMTILNTASAKESESNEAGQDLLEVTAEKLKQIKDPIAQPKKQPAELLEIAKKSFKDRFNEEITIDSESDDETRSEGGDSIGEDMEGDDLTSGDDGSYMDVSSDDGAEKDGKYMTIYPEVKTISFFADSHSKTEDNTKLRNFSANMAAGLETENTNHNNDPINNLATSFASIKFGDQNIESLDNYIATQIDFIKKSIAAHPQQNKPCYYLNINSTQASDPRLINPEQLKQIKEAIPNLFITVVLHDESVIDDKTKSEYLALADAVVLGGEEIKLSPKDLGLQNLERITFDSNSMQNLLINPEAKTSSTSEKAKNIHESVKAKIEAELLGIEESDDALIAGEEESPPKKHAPSIISVPAAGKETTKASEPSTKTTAAPPTTTTTAPKIIKTAAAANNVRTILRTGLLINEAQTSKQEDQKIYPTGTPIKIDEKRYEASKIISDSINKLTNYFITENKKLSPTFNFTKNAILAEAFKQFGANASSKEDRNEPNGADKDRIYISSDMIQFENGNILIGKQTQKLPSIELQFATFSGLCLAGDVFKDNPPKMWGMNFSNCQLGTWEKPLDFSKVDPNVLDTMQFRDCDLTYVIVPENYVWKVSALIHKKPKTEGAYTRSKIALEEVTTKDGRTIKHQVSDEAEYESPNTYFEKTIPNLSKDREGETKKISDMDGLDLAVKRYKPLNVVKDPVGSKVGAALDLAKAAGRTPE